MLNFFCDQAAPILNKRHLKFLNKFEKCIQSAVRARIYRPEDIEDCMQYVRLELLKLYKFRYKYGSERDWKNVVLSAIVRRAGDFRVQILRSADRFITENRLASDEDGFNIQDLFAVSKSADDGKRILKIVSSIINREKIFNGWDKEFWNILKSRFKGGEEIKDSQIRYYMGYDINDTEFKKNLNAFRRKIKQFRERIT